MSTYSTGPLVFQLREGLRIDPVTSESSERIHTTRRAHDTKTKTFVLQAVCFGWTVLVARSAGTHTHKHLFLGGETS